MIHYTITHFYFVLAALALIYAIGGAILDEVNHKRNKDYR